MNEKIRELLENIEKILKQIEPTGLHRDAVISIHNAQIWEVFKFVSQIKALLALLDEPDNTPCSICGIIHKKPKSQEPKEQEENIKAIREEIRMCDTGLTTHKQDMLVAIANHLCDKLEVIIISNKLNYELYKNRDSKVLDLQSKLEAAEKWVKIYSKMAEEYHKANQELSNSNVDIQLENQQLTRRIKQLEAHISGNPTAQLQFPQEKGATK